MEEEWRNLKGQANSKGAVFLSVAPRRPITLFPPMTEDALKRNHGLIVRHAYSVLGCYEVRPSKEYHARLCWAGLRCGPRLHKRSRSVRAAPREDASESCRVSPLGPSCV